MSLAYNIGNISSTDAGDAIISSYPVTKATVCYISTLESKEPGRRIGVHLMALALEHARSNSVTAALLDSPSSLRGYFSRFFRFRENAKKSPKKTNHPMACELDSMNHKFSILQRKTSVNTRKSTNGGRIGSDVSTLRVLATLKKGATQSSKGGQVSE